MYYEDLHVFAGIVSPDGVDKSIMRKVGWLAVGSEPFEVYDSLESIPQEFLDKLLILTEEHRVNQTKGWHTCSCGHSYNSSASIVITVKAYSDKRTIHYEAPTMIYHYVTEHLYRPPQEFIDAVIKGLPLYCTYLINNQNKNNVVHVHCGSKFGE